jgi:uncharacterized protein YutE (UPF0331/DUF86 family)
MSSAARASLHDEGSEFLEELRAHYESLGFAFTIAPYRSTLPAFMGAYEPDAVASKPGLNIAIEVRRRQSPATQASLQEIRRLFEGHPDWQLNAVFRGAGPLRSVTIPTALPAAIRKRLAEIRALVEEKHYRPAFVLAWALLEAALHSADEAEAGRPCTPGTVVQALVMNGHIDAELGESLQGLIALRNQIVHGNVAAEPMVEDVNAVLKAVEETLATGA